MIWKVRNWLCRQVGREEEKVLSQPADKPPGNSKPQTSSKSTWYRNLHGLCLALWAISQLTWKQLSPSPLIKEAVASQSQTLLNPRSSKSGSRERCSQDRKQPKQQHVFLPHSSSFQDQSADRKSQVATKIPQKVTTGQWEPGRG